jgi:hypothetical protein
MTELTSDNSINASPGGIRAHADGSESRHDPIIRMSPMVPSRTGFHTSDHGGGTWMAIPKRSLEREGQFGWRSWCTAPGVGCGICLPPGVRSGASTVVHDRRTVMPTNAPILRRIVE